MRTLAHALIHGRYVERGETTRIVVVPMADSGLPQQLVEAATPVPLDILAGRPTNLELGDAGLSVDLCFSGPPVRCSFPWEAVVAVQGPGDGGGVALVQTLVVTVATVMEDHTLRPASTDRYAGAADGSDALEQPTPEPPPAPGSRGRGRFQVIRGDK
jgi:stringent starvation protein B